MVILVTGAESRLLGSHQCVADLVVSNDLLLLGRRAPRSCAAAPAMTTSTRLLQIGLRDTVASHDGRRAEHASLMMLARSAPDAPEVARAIAVKSIGAGHLNAPWRAPSRMCVTALSDRAAQRECGGQNGRDAAEPGQGDSGRLVAARMTTPLVAVEAVHLGQQLVERLLALIVAAHACRRRAFCRWYQSRR